MVEENSFLLTVICYSFAGIFGFTLTFTFRCLSGDSRCSFCLLSIVSMLCILGSLNISFRKQWYIVLFSLSLCVSTYLSVCLPVCPSICPSVHPSICPSVCLSVCLSTLSKFVTVDHFFCQLLHTGVLPRLPLLLCCRLGCKAFCDGC